MPDSFDLTPEQWLSYLSNRLTSRMPELIRLRNYISGNAPLPKGATQYREAYAEWQKMSRTNTSKLVVKAKANRLKVSGFKAGQDEQDNDAARAIWTRSMGSAMATDIHRDALTYGVGYGMASEGRTGAAVLTRESPFSTIVEHDPLDPTWVLAGMKVWSDLKADHAVLHLPGEVHRFVRRTPGRNRLPQRPRMMAGGWEPDLEESGFTGLDRVPIVEFANIDEVGEFAEHTDVIDRINWVVLQRLLIIAMQAFRQRALEEDAKNEDALADTDEDGEDIDWNEAFIPGPDALWVLPAGVKIWESQPGDIGQILMAAKDDFRYLAGVTSTPMTSLIPDGENQTAEGAALAHEGLVYEVEDRQQRFGPKWDWLMNAGLSIDEIEAQVETQWAPAERQSLADRYDALSKAGDLPWRDRMTDVLGYGADRVDRMQANRERDAEIAAATQPTQ